MKTTFPQATDAPIVIIGGGGHTRVLIDVLELLGAHIDGIITQDSQLLGESILGHKVLGLEKDFAGDASKILLVNGVGNKARAGDSGLRTRAQLVDRFSIRGYRFASIISPHARVSAHNSLGEGVQILHEAIIQPASRIGAHAIINTGAIIEHDCAIGEHSHVAPAALLCGDVRLGAYVHVGANATLLQELVVGDAAIIGAGMRVTRNVAAGETVR